MIRWVSLHPLDDSTYQPICRMNQYLYNVHSFSDKTARDQIDGAAAESLSKSPAAICSCRDTSLPFPELQIQKQMINSGRSQEQHVGNKVTLTARKLPSTSFGGASSTSNYCSGLNSYASVPYTSVPPAAIHGFVPTIVNSGSQTALNSAPR